MKMLRLLGVLVVACGHSGGGGSEEAPPPGTDAPATTPGAPTTTDPADRPKPAPPSTFACDGRTGAVGDPTVTVVKGRSAFLHVPATYDKAKGTSLVMAFHGYGSSAADMRRQTGLVAEADKRGFIVAFVEGTGLAQKGFNGGDCCGAPAWTSKTDDLGIALELEKTIAEQYCVDPKRVYSAGFSNGGFMSYRFVCEAANVFAAVASVAGVLGTPPEQCKPSRPVPIIHVHGTADPTVPYNGGAPAGGLGALAGITFRSVADTVGTFRKLWTCEEASKPVSEKGDTKCEEWTKCAADARVELCTVTAGGHQWPGGQAQPVGGKLSTDLAATAAVIDFFDAHPMP